MKKFIIREFIEMVAPVTWVTSWRRLKTVFFQALLFCSASAVCYYSLIWVLTGVHETASALVVGIIALAGLPLVITLWGAAGLAAGGGYEEYK